MVKFEIKPQVAKPRVRPQRRRMTIGAGMLCPDGIVLCADTLETNGMFKSHRPKLAELTVVADDVKAVVVGSTDNAVFMDELVEKVSEALDLADGTLAEVRESVTKAVRKHCKDVWALYSPKDRPETELLLGLKTSDGLSLLHIEAPNVRCIDSWQFVGFGAELASYKAKQFGMGGLPVAAAAPLLAHILDIAKENVRYCGGDTHMAIIHPDGAIEHKSQGDIQEATHAYKLVNWAFDTFVFPVLPVAASEEGKDLLAMIAALGTPKSGIREKVVAAVNVLAARKKAIASGNYIAAEPTESERLIQAFASAPIAIKMLADAFPKLHKAGLISDEMLQDAQSRYDEAWQASTRVSAAISASNFEEARRGIAPVFAILMRLPPPPQTLTAQTSEGRS